MGAAGGPALAAVGALLPHTPRSTPPHLPPPAHHPTNHPTPPPAPLPQVVPVAPLPRALAKNLLHPFCLFQYASVAIWCYEEYWSYSGIILGITLITTVATSISDWRTGRRLAAMALYTCVSGWMGGWMGEWVDRWVGAWLRRHQQSCCATQHSTCLYYCYMIQSLQSQLPGGGCGRGRLRHQH